MCCEYSPIRVETDYEYANSRHRPVVYLGWERVWEGEWVSQYATLDLEGLKNEWTHNWEIFQAEQFKEWLKE